MKSEFVKIKEVIKQTKIKILIGLLIFVIVGAIVILLLGKEAAKYSLEGAVFFYKGDGQDSKLFFMNSDTKPQHLITLPSEKKEANNYRVPQHSFISNSGQAMIYFEKIDEVLIEADGIPEGFVAHRKIYKPKYVNLKTGAIEEIDKQLDTSGLVFSPNDEKIAWVLSIKESTIGEIESKGVKREAWISNVDGVNARLLATLDEKVISLAGWQDDYIYFLGVKGVGFYSLGRIDVKTGRVKRIQPKFCLENLDNCQNFNFSPSGDLFIYEAKTTEDNKEIVELFVESFDGQKSWKILTKNYISDRVWMPDGENVLYTEQETVQEPGPVFVVKEKAHLVNLKTNEDKEIYTGSYLSQLTFDGNGKYLYFIEKETDEKFNLVRLNLKDKETEILDSGQYNQLMIFSAN